MIDFDELLREAERRDKQERERRMRELAAQERDNALADTANRYAWEQCETHRSLVRDGEI